MYRAFLEKCSPACRTSSFLPPAIMADAETIRTAFQRNAQALSLRPSLGQKTTLMKVRLRDGTTCECEGSGWNLTVDVGKESGGNHAGPGPGVLERAALGSCLAIGYSTWAAVLEVPIDYLEVEIESDFDSRAMHSIGDKPPGFDAIRYRVIIESPASEADVMRVIDAADAHSPVRDDFSRAIPVAREVRILSAAAKL
jgi:uncharacterized OsmC-like protein